MEKIIGIARILSSDMNNCVVNYNDHCFGVLHRVEDKTIFSRLRGSLHLIL